MITASHYYFNSSLESYVPSARLLITGNGQLGSALAETASKLGWQAQAFGHDELDVCDSSQVEAVISRCAPALVIHTAALTQVALCERNAELATLVNANGTENVLAACEETATRLIFVSTDYVFDGTGTGPRVEDDTPAPLNIYGASKAVVEPLVLDYQRGHVLRTSGVFGPRPGHGERNFFRAIFDRLAEGEEVRVVHDQFTRVSFAPHLAEMLLELLGDPNRVAAGICDLPRITHLASAGADNWFGWAKKLALELGFGASLIQPISSRDYGDPTPRPKNSVLASRYQHINHLCNRYPALKGIQLYARYLVEAQ
jgi:dTDP-4-dehydrorhamnose reductase